MHFDLSLARCGRDGVGGSSVDQDACGAVSARRAVHSNASSLRPAGGDRRAAHRRARAVSAVGRARDSAGATRFGASMKPANRSIVRQVLALLLATTAALACAE